MDIQKVSISENVEMIDVKEVFYILWRKKIIIFFVTLVFAIGSVFYALSIPNQFKASVLLAPAQSDGGGLSSALGQFGGLASLAGVSISGGETSESHIAQEIMKSWSFVEKFIIDNNLAVKIYAAEGWNKNLNTIILNKELYDIESEKWLLKDSLGDEGPPSSWALFQRFTEMLAVTEDKRTGLVTVSIEYYSPQLAKEWLDLFVAKINEHMQARQVKKVSNNISYLEAQIAKTSIAEMKEVFYTIVEEQTKKGMVAKASPDYAFLAVSPSMVPEQKSQPNRAIMCVLGTLFGAMLSALIVLVNHFARGLNIKHA